MQKCYNCNQLATHISDNCPEGQKNTRCTSCRKVAYVPNAHAPWCRTPDFVSKPIEDSMVLELDDLCQIDFRDVDDRFLVIAGIKTVEITVKPIWLPKIEVFVSKYNKTLDFQTARSTKKLLVIVDPTDKPIISLQVDENRVIVNSRYILKKNGFIEYEYRKKCIVAECGTQIKVFPLNETFKMRLRIWSTSYVFDVYANGAVLYDPQMDEATKPIEQLRLSEHSNDDSNENAKITTGQNDSSSSDVNTEKNDENENTSDANEQTDLSPSDATTKKLDVNENATESASAESHSSLGVGTAKTIDVSESSTDAS